MAAELTFTRLDEEGHPYAVRRKDDSEGDRLGFVWRVDGSHWEAIHGLSGERSGPVFSTRGDAGDWLLGKWSVTDGPAAKFIPEDPFEGLPGA